MKYIITILIFSLAISCKNIEPKELIGSWKMRDIVDQTGKNASEKTTFYEADSLIIEMFANKKLIEKQSWRYKFDTISNMIHIEINENGKIAAFELKVLKLTNSEMELANSKQQKLVKYIRTK